MKAKARRSAREMAGELINLYAERQARRGFAFSPDGEWQLRLERSFPFRETADQLEAIEAVKADMESERPMDRLICGDVGYGKTEVAIRAAQKALADSKQVMILVPTTILATQHLGTFSERLRDFPYEIEMISRLRKPAEVKRALAAFADGSLDILIGTHRLLSRDVRAKDLGLLVIDEEQRFGVKQKELLRQLKLKVDVLSMSATPIPRTMQMSLSGLRDISVIETPPEGRRPVRTYVGPYDEELVAEALRREVRRKGQVFFLHNRIETLHDTAERLRALVPEASFLEAHGQLDEGELEATMLSFLRGDADVLVATTIIESGLDVPAANTLIVERADNLGLAQAYQIRGRVGRSRERAYAYMLYPSEEGVTREAAARLATLADHTELGSGFRIAMRDLELRGAGDLLGAEQSGHVAAIGFELYVEMLDQAVEELRSAGGAERTDEEVRVDTDVSAYVPSSYVPYEAAKIDIHRRIAGARAPGRAAGAPRRAARPVRPAAGADRGAALDPAGADRVRSRRRHQPAAPRDADRRRAARARIRPRRADQGADSGGDLQLPRRHADPAHSRAGRARSGADRAARGPRRCRLRIPGTRCRSRLRTPLGPGSRGEGAMQRPPPRYVSASVARPAKRKLAIVLAVILVAVVALVAATSGLGQPGLPEGDVAYVDDVDNGGITQDQLDAGIDQAAAQGGLQKAPPPDDPQYQALHDQALQSLILAVWVEGEAKDRGITVTQDDIDSELAQIKKQSFSSEAEFNKFVKQSKFTDADVQEQVKLTRPARPPRAGGRQGTDDLRRRDQEVLRRQHRQLQAARQPATSGSSSTPRRQKAEQAKQALEADDSDASWKKVAAPVLPGSGLQGPRRPARGIDRGPGRPAARGPGLLGPRGRDRRPLQDRPRLLRHRGEPRSPRRRPSRSTRLRPRSSSSSISAKQQQIAADFQTDFTDKWTARTICAAGQEIELCSNYVAPVTPSRVPASRPRRPSSRPSRSSRARRRSRSTGPPPRACRRARSRRRPTRPPQRSFRPARSRSAPTARPPRVPRPRRRARPPRGATGTSGPPAPPATAP